MDIKNPAVRSVLHKALVNFPANGKPPHGFSTEEGMVTMWLREYGLLEEKTMEKRCPACGSPRDDYTYMKITPAGRLFMLAMTGGGEEG